MILQYIHMHVHVYNIVSSKPLGDIIRKNFILWIKYIYK